MRYLPQEKTKFLHFFPLQPIAFAANSTVADETENTITLLANPNVFKLYGQHFNIRFGRIAKHFLVFSAKLCRAFVADNVAC